ncbi:nickel insertion protein [Yinghuangia aomiensis]
MLAPQDRRLGCAPRCSGLTTTLGVREYPVHKSMLGRGWADVPVLGARLPVKIGHRHGVIVQATLEFDPAARLAAELGMPVRAVLDAAAAAARSAGIGPRRSLAGRAPRLAADPIDGAAPRRTAGTAATAAVPRAAPGLYKGLRCSAPHSRRNHRT